MRSCWHPALLPEEKGELEDFLKGTELHGHMQHMLPVNNSWQRHHRSLGHGDENREQGQQQEAPGSTEGGKKLPYIKQIYGFALWECETKGNALMLRFVYH